MLFYPSSSTIRDGSNAVPGAAWCLDGGGLDVLEVWFDFRKRWCFCSKQKNSLCSTFFNDFKVKRGIKRP